MYELAGEMFNRPLVQNQKEEDAFQAEIKAEYQRLVDRLSIFGDEGDHYGISDFAIRPTLKEWPTVKPPPAAHNRQFCVCILTKKFYRSDFLPVVHELLSRAPTAYQIEISTDFDPELYVNIFMTVSVAKIFCKKPKETDRLQRLLAAL